MNAASKNLTETLEEKRRIEKEETPCACAFCCVNSAVRATCKCAKIVHEMNHRHEPLLIKCKSCSYEMPGCETCQQKIRYFSVEIDKITSKNCEEQEKLWCINCKMYPLINVSRDSESNNLPKCIECDSNFNIGNNRKNIDQQKNRLIKCAICTHYYAVCGYQRCIDLHKTVCELCYKRFPLESLKQDAVYHDKKYEMEKKTNEYNHNFGLNQYASNSVFSTLNTFTSSSSSSATATIASSMMNEQNFLKEEIKKLQNDVCKLQKQMRDLIESNENNNDSKKRKIENTQVVEVEKK